MTREREAPLKRRRQPATKQAGAHIERMARDGEQVVEDARDLAEHCACAARTRRISAERPAKRARNNGANCSLDAWRCRWLGRRRPMANGLVAKTHEPHPRKAANCFHGTRPWEGTPCNCDSRADRRTNHGSATWHCDIHELLDGHGVAVLLRSTENVRRQRSVNSRLLRECGTKCEHKRRQKANTCANRSAVIAVVTTLPAHAHRHKCIYARMHTCISTHMHAAAWREHANLRHHRYVIQAVKIRKRLLVVLVLDQLLGASMEQSDVRIRTLNILAIQLKH
eukprot:3407116-Pleurochrysis_carterae.AAC.4